ncbi:hypothetical protein [Bacillus sp. NEAU-Y102]
MKDKIKRTVYVVKNYHSLSVDERVTYANMLVMSCLLLSMFVFGTVSVWGNYDYANYRVWVGMGIFILTPFIWSGFTVKGILHTILAGSIYTTYMLGLNAFVNGGLPEGLHLWDIPFTLIGGSASAVITIVLANSLEKYANKA